MKKPLSRKIQLGTIAMPVTMSAAPVTMFSRSNCTALVANRGRQARGSSTSGSRGSPGIP
jgi:hypothetical protein